MVDIANQQFKVPPKINIEGIGIVPVPSNVKTQLELKNFISAYSTVKPSAAKDIGNVALNALKNVPVNIVGSPVDTARMLRDVGTFVQGKALGMSGMRPEMVTYLLEKTEPGIINTLADIPAGSQDIRGAIEGVTGANLSYQPLTPEGQSVQYPLNSAMQVLAARNPASLLRGPGAKLAAKETTIAATGAKLGEMAGTSFDLGEYAPVAGAVADIGTQMFLSRFGKVTAGNIAKKDAPTAEDFELQNSSLWRRLDDMKARINPGTLKNEIKNLTIDKPEYLDAGGFPDTQYYLKRLSGKGGPVSYSFNWLQSIRSDIAKDLRTGKVKGREERAFSDLIDSIDNAIESGSFQPTVGGTSPISSQEIASLYSDARSMHKQLVKSNKIERILEQSVNEKNKNAYIQNEFRKILRDEKALRAFSPEEIAYLKSPLGRSELAETAANYISSVGTVGGIASGDNMSAIALKLSADLLAKGLRSATRSNPRTSAEETASIIRLGMENLKKAREAELLDVNQRRTGRIRGGLASLYTQGILGGEEDRR